jgi:hypothetical protein
MVNREGFTSRIAKRFTTITDEFWDVCTSERCSTVCFSPFNRLNWHPARSLRRGVAILEHYATYPDVDAVRFNQKVNTDLITSDEAAIMPQAAASSMSSSLSSLA